ncbi:DUF892 family protein [Flavisolibacter ginsenosidimutans]|uniref:DUF892 family protein n=1 Tax=Flavisolibacter ginsenosidimutans TaxID=661481 RepID=A0A5B8UIS5_9BACT|nr:DUF892 family protein [Flavisolibacter ginsenosidimutans]QEC56443.1 DUF892 family protein [Flavisolibacter ginsenosidimutans]
MLDEKNTVQSFLQQIQHLFSAELQLTQAIPKMMAKAKGLGLRKNLVLHLAETDQHKEALRLICKSFDAEAGGVINADMQAILEEGEQAISNAGDDVDAVIIAGAKKVEAWEIAQYETVSQTAKSLGYVGIAARLRFTQQEEIQTLTKLSFMEKELPFKEVQLATMNL